MKRQINESFLTNVGKYISHLLPGSDDTSSVKDISSSEKKATDLETKFSGLTREKIELRDALQVNPRKVALIIGSSQAGVSAPTVMRSLESHEFVDFKIHTDASTSMTAILSSLSGLAANKHDYDVIIIYPGYRSGEKADVVLKIIGMFEAGRCFVVVPPPVTEILNPLKASSLGLNKGKEVPADYWFRLKGGNYAKQREDFCEDLKQKVTTIGATAIDPRDVVTGGEQQPTGVVFPSLEDGIHPSQALSQELATAIVDTILTSDRKVSAAYLLQRLENEDLIDRPEIVQILSKYPITSKVIDAVLDEEGALTDTAPAIRTSKSLTRVPARSDKEYPISRGVGLKKDPLNPGKWENHQGLDIATPVGTPVAAALDGVVKYVGDNHNKAGNYIEIKHANGDLTRYLHLSEIHVSKGQKVSRGEIIGLTGGARGAYGSGKSSGPHLHWETWRGDYRTGQLIEPNDWLASNTDAIKPVNFA